MTYHQLPISQPASHPDREEIEKKNRNEKKIPSPIIIIGHNIRNKRKKNISKNVSS